MKMEAGENVHEDVLIWHLKVIKVESPDHDNNIMVSFGEVWSNRDKPMSTDDWTKAGTTRFEYEVRIYCQSRTNLKVVKWG